LRQELLHSILSLEVMLMLILGVDAAWSAGNPSGVALVEWKAGEKPRLLLAARSYEEYCKAEPGQAIEWNVRVTGSIPVFGRILKKTQQEYQRKIEIIALDLPLSPEPMLARRTCDNLVSSLYGKRGAAVHSPTDEQLSRISGKVFDQLTRRGYDLNLTAPAELPQRGLFMEVYPHIAIIELLQLPYRLPYKVHKRSTYWKNATAPERLRNICGSLEALRLAIAENMAGVTELLPPISEVIDEAGCAVNVLKGYEDTLDAVVCGWMGYKYACGEAVGYGDHKGMIWGPVRQLIDGNADDK